MILGFVLGLMFYKTKNIWVNVVAHFLNNAFAVTQLFMLSRHNTKPDLTKMEPGISWWMGLIALALVIYLFRLLEKRSADNKASIEAKEAVMLAEGDPFRSFGEDIR